MESYQVATVAGELWALDRTTGEGVRPDIYRWTGGGWTLFTAPALTSPIAAAVAGDGTLWTYGVQRHEGTARVPVKLPIADRP